jgi:Fe-S-cluster-containing dehydrogenase component
MREMPERSSQDSKLFTRRNFLLSSAATGTTLLLLGTSNIPLTRAQRPKHAILVDVSKCIACMQCIGGCETYHRQYDSLSAKGNSYTKVAVVDNEINVPELCLHCFDSPCTKACITHALTQLDYGPVVYDREKCIGCLLCVNQCPFGSITFDPIQKRIYKCDMCHKTVEEGKVPYCVRVCPTGTRTFGLYEDKLAEGMKLAEQKQGVLLYPRDTGTLYVLTPKEFERLVDGTDVTVIKDGYPAESRWVGDVLKYSRLAWIPLALGTAFYISKWTKHASSGEQ